MTSPPRNPPPRKGKVPPRPQPDEMARAITSWMRLDDNDRALVLARLRRAWADEDTKDGRDALCVADYLLRAAEKAGKP